MNTARKLCESDDQGFVHVIVPVGRSGQKVEVLVVWEEVNDPENPTNVKPDLFDLVGLLQDVDLERPKQDNYETREPIE